MNRYLKIARLLPRPAPEQITNFVEHVVEVHSWYKHLPLNPPGYPFVFFLDPNAGLDLMLGSNGTVTYRERTESPQQLHHASCTTREYRERFGHLEFFTPGGTWLLRGERDGALCTRSPWAAVHAGAAYRQSPWTTLFRGFLGVLAREKIEPVPDELGHGGFVLKSPGPPQSFFSREGWVGVPPRVAGAGNVHLTGVIHPLSSDAWLWKSRFRPDDAGSFDWPRESGGMEVVQELLAIADKPPENAEERLDQLLAPERTRQKESVVQAIRRMLEIVCGP